MNNKENNLQHKNRNCFLYGVCSGNHAEKKEASSVSKFGLKILSLFENKTR